VSRPAQDDVALDDARNTNRDGQKMPDPVEAILQRFPGPVTLNASRKKWGLMLLVAIGFVGGGVYVLFFDHSERAPGSFLRIVFWVGLVFFGLAIPLAGVLLLRPNASRIVLDRNGFETTQLFRSRRTLWNDAIGFQVFSLRGNPMVVFDDAKQKGRNLALLNTSLAGRNSGVPDTYGLAAEDLVRLMNQWRERTLK
jgi:hypothetical protein